ncbi:MAG: 50S ribosome-binding GTPase [Candidatus Hydrogenedentes bacterium]|nr:50S ribosome-binding GTPase [Candidatus Hydrogenedentota bacterium]
MEFERGLERLRSAVSSDPSLGDTLFSATETWTNLLTYKLVPHLAGEGCLVVAVTGGTNTGKSTIFNCLAGAAISPVTPTAAATRHPILAGNRSRAEQSLQAKLVPEFKPLPLKRPESALYDGPTDDTIYVAVADGLPDRLVLLDTPDIDSIEHRNWTVAEHIQAAGDVLVAVVTAEKYKDERVVEFFRRAHRSGRIILPVLNKANPQQKYAVARKQLDEFCEELELDGPRYVVPHDYSLATNFAGPVSELGNEGDLRTYLESLDVPSIKHRVLRQTIAHFATHAGNFLEQARALGQSLLSVQTEFEQRGKDYSRRYEPIPGAAVGGLFHTFVQSKRGPVRKVIGAASTTLYRVATTVAKSLVSAFVRRATLEPPEPSQTDAELRALHKQKVAAIVHDLATSYVESSRNLREPAAHLVRKGIISLKAEEAAAEVVREAVSSEVLSESFQTHAQQVLEVWWHDHKGKRRVMEALDALLAVTPTAIAAPLSFYSGGIGVTEAIAVAGPFVEQFVARIVEYQFGDAMFDFLSPWRLEQQQKLEHGLLEHITAPCLECLRDHVEVLTGPITQELMQCLHECQNAYRKY